MKQELMLIYEKDSTDAAEAWGVILSYLRQSGIDEGSYEVNIGRGSVTSDKIRKRIERFGRPYFGIKGEKYKFNLSSIAAGRHDRLSIFGDNCSLWDDWLHEMRTIGSFVHALVVDSSYYYWQNAQDPVQYESKGRSYEGLPMKSNGESYSRERLMIDTSRNPGRRILRRGFLEAIGSPMWFDENFWKLTGGNRDELKAVEGIDVRDDQGLTRVSFGGPVGEHTDGQLMEKVRRILYAPEPEQE